MTSTVPTGAMRCATAFSESPSLPAAGCVLIATKLVSMMMTITGTTNASTRVTMSCFGVLIGPSCGASWSGVYGAVVMQFSMGRGRRIIEADAS